MPLSTGVLHSMHLFSFLTVPLQVGTNAMDSTLLKYSAKDYFFKAALCHFCVDMLNAKVCPSFTLSLLIPFIFSRLNLSQKSFSLFSAQLALQKYEDLFPAFSDSRECKLLKVGSFLFQLLSNL